MDSRKTKPFKAPWRLHVRPAHPELDRGWADSDEHCSQHPKDSRRERRIRQLADECVELLGGTDADKEHARDKFLLMANEVANRSPAQIARMEQARGLR